jgi:hypothetical protein
MARVDRFFELSERPVLKEFLTASETFCGTNWEVAQVEYANRTEEGFQLRDYCFEGLYTFTLLTWGYVIFLLSLLFQIFLLRITVI